VGKDRKQRQDELEEGRLLTEGQHLRQTALDESKLDPYRGQMAQIRNLFALDMAGSKRTPIRPPSNVAPYAASGGGSYGPSGDLLSYLDSAKRSIASGRGVPTMTDPANYGQTGALDLLGIMGGGVDPSSPQAFAQQRRPGASASPAATELPWWPTPTSRATSAATRVRAACGTA
jgi:hypothetical protein